MTNKFHIVIYKYCVSTQEHIQKKNCIESLSIFTFQFLAMTVRKVAILISIQRTLLQFIIMTSFLPSNCMISQPNPVLYCVSHMLPL